MANGVAEILWLRSLLEELGIEYEKPLMLYCDNQAAINISLSKLGMINIYSQLEGECREH